MYSGILLFLLIVRSARAQFSESDALDLDAGSLNSYPADNPLSVQILSMLHLRCPNITSSSGSLTLYRVLTRNEYETCNSTAPSSTAEEVGQCLFGLDGRFIIIQLKPSILSSVVSYVYNTTYYFVSYPLDTFSGGECLSGVRMAIRTAPENSIEMTTADGSTNPPTLGTDGGLFGGLAGLGTKEIIIIAAVGVVFVGFVFCVFTLLVLCCCKKKKTQITFNAENGQNEARSSHNITKGENTDTRDVVQATYKKDQGSKKETVFIPEDKKNNIETTALSSTDVKTRHTNLPLTHSGRSSNPPNPKEPAKHQRSSSATTKSGGPDSGVPTSTSTGNQNLKAKFSSAQNEAEAGKRSKQNSKFPDKEVKHIASHEPVNKTARDVQTRKPSRPAPLVPVVQNEPDSLPAGNIKSKKGYRNPSRSLQTNNFPS